MKHIGVALMLLAMSLAIGGCKTTTDSPVGTRWQLVAVESSEPPTVTVPTDLESILTFHEDGYALFSAGCGLPVASNYDFGQQEDKMFILRPMGCLSGRADASDLEFAFWEFALTADAHEFTADELVIHSPTATWRFGRLPDMESVADPLDGTRWQLVSMTGLDDTLALFSNDLLPTLSFQEGGFRFITGCNNPGGSYVVRDLQLEVSAVRTTTKLCHQKADDPALVVERTLATIALTLDAYSISGDELRLGYPGGELVFKRLPDA